MAILPDLSKMTNQQLQTLVRAMAEANGAGKVSIRKTADGRKASVYHGHGRFPITAYREQWLAVLDHAEELRGVVMTLPEKGGE